MKMEARFDILRDTDIFVMIADCEDGGRSVTYDAVNVVHRVSSLLGGIGKRRFYCRDTKGRFDEIKVIDESFAGFFPFTNNQQDTLQGWMPGKACPAAAEDLFAHS